MSREDLALLAVGLLLSLNLWFMRRLVASFDEFKAWVREKIEIHDRDLIVMQERHRMEDRSGVRPPYTPREA